MGTDGGAIAMDPAVALSGYFVPQGISADLIATKYGYSRQDVDNFALSSQLRAQHAIENNFFKKSIIPVKDINGFTVLDKDENPRPETTLDILGSLEPSFTGIGEYGGFDAVAIDRYPEIEKINHVHHAGNSSAIVDGASIALIGSKAAGEKMGIRPRARIKSVATYGTDPTMMLVGPAPTSKLALKKVARKCPKYNPGMLIA
jgi:acetyl-CoA C-acetyltransferase